MLYFLLALILSYRYIFFFLIDVFLGSDWEEAFDRTMKNLESKLVLLLSEESKEQSKKQLREMIKTYNKVFYFIFCVYNFYNFNVIIIISFLGKNKEYRFKK